MDKIKSNFEVFMEQLNYLRNVPTENDNVELGQITKEKEVGIFFKRKIIEVEKTYILRKGKYISFRGLCIYLQKYIQALNSINYNFNKCFQKVLDERIDGYQVNLKDNILKISYEDSYCEKVEFKIDFNEFPRITKGNPIVYDEIKDELYKYITKLSSYQNFIGIIKDNISLSEKITFEIEYFNLWPEYITVKLKFGDFALYEIKIMKDEMQILVFSRDMKIDNFFFSEENKEKLLNEIFIEEDKVKEIIEICELTCK